MNKSPVKVKSSKEKRSAKTDQKSNKGLIGAATMLSVVGMLNYMGNGQVPTFTSLNEQYTSQVPLEQFRILRAQDAKNDIENFVIDEEEEQENSYDVYSIEEDMQPLFDEYDFAGNLVPAMLPLENKMEQSGNKNGILNQSNTGMTLQEAYVAFDMRESYLQRHASPLALQAADATELETKEFTTKSFNMWKTDEISLYPHTTKPCNLASPETIEDNSTSIYQEKVSFYQCNKGFIIYYTNILNKF